MPAELTEKEFSKHVKTKFRATLDAETEIDLELYGVKSYLARPEDQQGMERFSVFFRGPTKPFLPQHTYSFSHDAMGAFDLFLVPIQPDGEGARYEAVFNYFKK
jgi:hypothetical protein